MNETTCFLDAVKTDAKTERCGEPNSSFYEWRSWWWTRPQD